MSGYAIVNLLEIDDSVAGVTCRRRRILAR